MAIITHYFTQWQFSDPVTSNSVKLDPYCQQQECNRQSLVGGDIIWVWLTCFVLYFGTIVHELLFAHISMYFCCYLILRLQLQHNARQQGNVFKPSAALNAMAIVANNTRHWCQSKYALRINVCFNPLKGTGVKF